MIGSTNPDLLSVNEAAQTLGVRHSLVRRLFDAGELQGFRVGAAIRIRRVSVEQYIARRSNIVRGDERAAMGPSPEPEAEPAQRRRRKSGKRSQSFGSYYVAEMRRIDTKTSKKGKRHD